MRQKLHTVSTSISFSCPQYDMCRVQLRVNAAYLQALKCTYPETCFPVLVLIETWEQLALVIELYILF